MNEVKIQIPGELSRLYSLSDAERFPSFQETKQERPSTLFYADIKVAERFGLRAVRETLRDCHIEQRGASVLTELYIAINHLIWEAYDRGNEELQEIYQNMYEKIYEMSDSWTKAEREHFFLVTD